MPGRLERHGRGDGRDSRPSRSAELAAAITGPQGRRPGRKDRWARCKANRGRAHILVISLRKDPGPGPQDCRWYPVFRDGAYEVTWHCHHHEACENCGKESRYLIRPEECPDYPGRDAQLTEAEDEAARMGSRHRAWQPRRPAPDGPQGYRRPRAGRM